MIHFKINGKKVKASGVGDAIMKAGLKSIETQIREKIGSIRDPKTDEVPTVVAHGDIINNLRMHVEGSQELIKLVREKMGDDKEMNATQKANEGAPHVFLSYTSDVQR